jgi:FkbM family methyltransferase
VKSFRHLAGHTLRALRSDAPDRAAVVRDFARLTIARATGDEHRSGATTVQGSKVSFQDHALLVDMFEEIFIQGEYAIADPGPISRVLDCGSNIGLSVLYFARRYPDATITCFEADPLKAALLAQNVEQNQLSKRVEVVQKAVGAADGESAFHFDARDPGSLTSSLVRSHRDTTTVEVTRLSPYVGSGVDLLKLDVEGSELDVLEELAASGALDCIGQLLVEVHHNVTEDRTLLSSVIGLLQEARFTLQVRAPLTPPYSRGVMQDILIYAYR